MHLPGRDVLAEGAKVKNPRVIGVAWVLATSIGMVAVNEPIRGMFDGTASFNWLGYLALGTLLIAVPVGAALVIRARRLDPTFRGVLSESIRLVALAEGLVIILAWTFYLTRR